MRARLVAAIPVLALLLAACGSAAEGGNVPEGSAAAPSPDGEVKQSLVVAVPALTPTLDGVVGGGGTTLEAFAMNANLQAGLVRNPYIEGDTPGTVQQDFNSFEGYVAESYEVSDDGLTYTFHLREGLLSQVGNPITADDVIWSFERKWATPTYGRGAWAPAFTDPATQLQKIDDMTVAFTITQAGLGFNFLGLLANLFGHIYDSTLLLEHATPEDPYAVEWARQNSGWGLGPYMVESWTPDQEMVLAANPNYVFGEPATKEVVLRVVPDAGTRASLLMTGDIDMTEGLRPADQVQLADAPGVVVPTVENPIEYLDLTLVTNKEPFDDETVRQAMAWAIPYEEIIEQVYSGRAGTVVGSVNPSFAGYSTDDLPVYSFDPERARELLSEAGHADGVAFTLSVPSTVPDVVDAAVLIQSYAQEAGFDITIDQQTAGSFGTGRQDASFQALMYRNRSQTQSPTYALTIFWQPDDHPSNPSRWDEESSRRFWDVVNQALAIPDPLSDEAGLLWQEAMAIELESAPEIFVASMQPTQAWGDHVTGWAYRSENATDYGNLVAYED